jgi:hypothetical protein
MWFSNDCSCGLNRYHGHNHMTFSTGSFVNIDKNITITKCIEPKMNKQIERCVALVAPTNF